MYLLFCFLWEEGCTFLYDFVNVKLIGKKKSRSNRNDSFFFSQEACLLLYFYINGDGLGFGIQICYLEDSFFAIPSNKGNQGILIKEVGHFQIDIAGGVGHNQGVVIHSVKLLNGNAAKQLVEAGGVAGRPVGNRPVYLAGSRSNYLVIVGGGNGCAVVAVVEIGKIDEL